MMQKSRIPILAVCLAALLAGLPGCDTLRTLGTVVDQMTLVVASIGDSYSSGQGNPPFDNGEAAAACYRSYINGPQYALDIVAPYWRTADGGKPQVVYRSFACSGASIDRGLVNKQADVYGPQLQELVNWEYGRNLDMLIISIGGNDIGFAGIVIDCLKPCLTDCHCTLSQDNENAFKELPDKFKELAEEIDDIIDRQLINKDLRIVITGYPTPLWDHYTSLCTEWDDCYTIDGATWKMIKEGLIAEGLALPINPPELLLPGVGTLTREEAAYLDQDVVLRLNQIIEEAAEQHGWYYVDTWATSRGHGICSANRWFNNLGDSYENQGNYLGALHPNVEGHRAIGVLISKKLTEILGLAWNPRVIEVQVDAKIVDDEVFVDEEEVYHLHEYIPLFPHHSRYQNNPLPESFGGIRPWEWSHEHHFCVGDEVRVDLDIQLELLETEDPGDADGTKVIVNGRLYEGIDCYCSVFGATELEDSESISAVIPSTGALSLSISLVNSEPFGGDRADIKISFEDRLGQPSFPEVKLP